jgi:hypothetical protein
MATVYTPLIASRSDWFTREFSMTGRSRHWIQLQLLGRGSSLPIGAPPGSSQFTGQLRLMRTSHRRVHFPLGLATRKTMDAFIEYPGDFPQRGGPRRHCISAACIRLRLDNSSTSISESASPQRRSTSTVADLKPERRAVMECLFRPPRIRGARAACRQARAAGGGARVGTS